MAKEPIKLSDIKIKEILEKLEKIGIDKFNKIERIDKDSLVLTISGKMEITIKDISSYYADYDSGSGQKWVVEYTLMILDGEGRFFIAEKVGGRELRLSFIGLKRN
ncbi:MAG: hypothetical protein PHE59_04965 [Patescibacteria group bacterium]|nr:hypothetical protein [Patescibacteria group bacterium]MDD5164079.1 hypothetical protein [Patescibacteria group bacterium]MDD5534263.1 hypothetical protein [Patescibacteria group bacterium]